MYKDSALPVQRLQVQSLVGELRSHKLCSMVKRLGKKKKKKKNLGGKKKDRTRKGKRSHEREHGLEISARDYTGLLL